MELNRRDFLASLLAAFTASGVRSLPSHQVPTGFAFDQATSAMSLSSWSHTCAGANRLLVVAIDDPRVARVGFGTNALDLLTHSDDGRFFALIDPPLGQHDISLMDGDRHPVMGNAMAISYAGVSTVSTERA